MTSGLPSALPVLLVEDNEIDVEITKRVFAKSGAAVRLQIARDGQEALEFLSRRHAGEAPQPDATGPPRLVLLDLRLPMVDGLEVLRRIKNDPTLCTIPVAILTGAQGERPMRECAELGTNMYFVKPISIADAMNIVTVVQKYWALVERLMERAD